MATNSIKGLTVFERDLLLKAVLDADRYGIIATDRNGKINVFNHGAEQILGYEAAHFFGRDVLDFIDEIYLKSELEEENERLSREFGGPVGIREMFTRAVQIYGTYKREWNAIRRDGTKVPTSVTLKAMRDENGEFCGIVAVWLDISERKVLERDVQDRDTMLNTILDGGKHAIVLADRNQIIKLFNRASEQLFGYEAEDFLETRLEDLFQTVHVQAESEEEAKKLSEEFGIPISPRKVLDIALEREGIHEREWTIVRRDGTKVLVWLTAYIMRDKNREIYGYMSIAQDITARKEVEKLKNEFISTVSHELRTPLTSVHAVLGMMVQGAMDPKKAKELISIAYKNSERLVLLLNDILAVEKLESGNLSLHMTSVNAAKIIQQAIEINQPFALKHEVILVRKQVDKSAYVMADRDRLMQVLTNLLSNAVKYSRPGYEIRLGAEFLDGQLRFVVQDFGPGIPDLFRENIFENFARADSSDSREHEGSGLGLSISKKLVEAMNGSLGFESKPGVGTTFFLDLPLATNRQTESRSKNSL